MAKKYKLDKTLWFKIHKKAMNANNYKRKKKFIKFIKKIHDSIKCSECKSHMRQYIYNEPFVDYLDMKDGLFNWSWNFHNAVNNRINKDMVSYQDAYNMFKR
jgi:hypothetical protein